jgi:microcystin-dependent protein
MALPVRKGYTGNGVQTTLITTTLNDTDTSTVFTVATSTLNWPVDDFYIVMDPGTSKEEKMFVTSVSGATITATRGVDNTAKKTHSGGAVVYPVFAATEADEANKIASAMTTKGDLIATDGSDITRLPVGTTNTHVLQVDSTATNGFKWGQVIAGGIASDAVTTAKILDLNVTEGKIADGAVTSAKIASKTIVEADVATALLKLVCPVGTISAYPGATAPTGWLLCTGVSTTGYTELIALVGATTPDLQGKVLVGKGAAPFDGALLSSFGSTTSTAPHTHSDGTLATASASANITLNGGNHSHTGTTNADGNHQHKVNTSSTPNTTAHQHSISDRLALGASTQNALQNTFDVNNDFSNHQHGITTNAADTGHSLSDATHSHDVTGSTGASSAAATHGNVQPSTIINYIIKHDYA